MQKGIENLEFVQGVHFEFTDSLKYNSTKYLLIFDDSCEEICNSKAFVDFDIGGRHRGLSTIRIKHDLFLQCKLGRDVELQNTHKILFKSCCEVMQVSTLTVQLNFGSELVHWYLDATFVPNSQYLINSSLRTDDRLRKSTNTWPLPSKFFIPDRLKQSDFLNDEPTESLYSPSVPITFPQKQKSFISVSPKRVYPVSLRTRNKSAQTNPAKKFEARFDYCFYNVQLGGKEETFWRWKEGNSSLKLLLLPSLTICLDMELFVLLPASV